MKAGMSWLAVGLWLWASSASAASSANLDLKVTLTGTLSVSVDGAAFSTQTLSGGANALLAPGSSSTVTNDSAGLTEQWSLSVATASGGGNWAAQPSTNAAPGVDQYAVQALFISSAAAAVCPGTANSKWNTVTSVVTGSGQTYASARYADATAQGNATGNPDAASGGSDGNMFATGVGGGAGRRGLCLRLYMPAGSTSPSQQVIRLTVTAAPGV